MAVVWPSVFVIARSASALTVSRSLARLLAGTGSAPLLPSSATLALLRTCVTPGGLFTVTAKLTSVEPPPPASGPTVKVQLVPAGDPSAHDHPAVLEPALNVVPAGTTSVTTTPVAPWPPRLETVSTYTVVSPATTWVRPSFFARARSGAAPMGVIVGSAF